MTREPQPREASPETSSEHPLVIDAGSRLKLLDTRELWRFRDLFYHLVWKDVKTRYAQSVLGIGWAVFQPVFTMLVFTVVFGNLAKIDSDGVPYSIFSYSALVPWTYFSAALTGATASLIASSAMVSKVYFPRLVIPLAPVLARLIDFAVALAILFGLMAWYGIAPTVWAAALPFLVLLMMTCAAGLGLWLTPLAAQYRDVKYAMSFVIQMLMYAAPVVYPTSAVPESYRLFYAVNPMVGVIEGFRSALLGTIPMPLDLIAVGSVSALVILLTGLVYFRRTELYFADVV
ncbi:MAG: ABC transporter permease [Thermoanaerobaculia bacterium]|nr:ABC transporter permease [Thermoanaerobaculia bacterium]